MNRLLLALVAIVYAANIAHAQVSSPATNVAIAVTGGGGGSDPTVGLLPPDRDAYQNWKMAGLQPLGGIPARTVCRTLSPLGGGQSDANQINNALTACNNGVVLLNAGTFTLLHCEHITMNNPATLRGAAMGATIITYPAIPAGGGGCTFAIIAGWLVNTTNDSGHATALSADANQGALTVSANCGGNCATSFPVGSLVMVDERGGEVYQTEPSDSSSKILSSPDWRVVYHIHSPFCDVCGDDGTSTPTDTTYMRSDRPVNEIHLVSAVSGNNVTFDSPIMTPYRVSHTAQLSTFVDSLAGTIHMPVQEAGIENLTIKWADAGAVNFIGCLSCWAKNVEATGIEGSAFVFDWSLRDEIDSNWMHYNYNPLNAAGSYAIVLDRGSSELLIQDNIDIEHDKVIIARAGGAGSVVAYNYMDKGIIDNNPHWEEVGINASHFVGPHHVLFEGNWTWNIDGDFTHGNATNLTYFRNFVRGAREPFTNGPWLCLQAPSSPCSYDPWNGVAINDITQGNGVARFGAMQNYHYWYTFVGNVLGAVSDGWATNGWTFNYQNCIYPQTNFTANIWMLGWGETEPDQSIRCDPQITNQSFAGHVIRAGNWDISTGAQKWEDGSAPAAIPGSFYLANQTAPAFFSGFIWPWADPSTGSVATLPAKNRFDTGPPP